MRQRRMRFYRMRARRRKQLMLLLLSVLIVSPERTIWSRERSSHWWERIVNETFDDRDWQESFRMRRETFEYLVNELALHLPTPGMWRSISMRRRVAVTLWILAHGTDYRTVGHLFGLGRSTVCMIFRHTVVALATHIAPLYIQMPTGERLDAIVRGFEETWGMPQCVGAMDGTHIPIVAPLEHKGDYYNRKGFYSLVAQVVCDHETRVLDVVVGWPGSVHDARVLANSNVYRKAEEGRLFPMDDQHVRNIEGIDVPLFILGDSAYPLKPYLMRPFPDNGHLNRMHTNYNYRHSRARMPIECCFGRTKKKWSILQYRIDFDTEFVSHLLMACFALHNISLVHKHEMNFEFILQVEQDREHRGYHPPPREERARFRGKDIRESLMGFFNR
ncbi:protein ANTAGONIST OF LIKE HETEROCHROMATIN PROTEIN 1 [Lingula anatina]|uniref:Protein ANTAGONIST OF LIKE HETEROCHROMATIN PROTEIN 1 n=1 Tax=Lingula anatina TaxID=7574 RepID=A0A1S3JHC8_LINAN|nr:protein ANTAGONIST OF LIKE HETEROCHROMATIN PROTEIN 1 [Lingula anatina]|eukprot:XP_013409304.1 protein ANTAGONIST OF LIKE HETEROCHROMATIN PROTEIN 1 [Lingula anatina]